MIEANRSDIITITVNTMPMRATMLVELNTEVDWTSSRPLYRFNGSFSRCDNLSG